ncbi:sulfotransferase domain-containing protein [Magnetococcus sp. PR-3]|uniref:sulfotransferase domain-containing protein n=1 Tax=Magnetococcus sp. PR-3 TaxID=3120355 RepID=UPI002FCE12C5
MILKIHKINHSLDGEDSIPLLNAHTSDFIRDFYTTANTRFDIESDAKQVLICSQPRSASTFLSNVLRQALSYTTVHFGEQVQMGQLAAKLGITPPEGENTGFIAPNHQLYMPMVLGISATNCNNISHHHLIANLHTLWQMTLTDNFIPIVTTRNIADSLVSIRDSLVKHSPDTITDYMAQFTLSGIDFMWRYRSGDMIKKFLEGDESYRLDMLIDLLAPWFFDYLLSWHNLARKKIIDIRFVDYEQITRQDFQTVRSLITHIGAEATDDQIHSAIRSIKGDRQKSEFNVGKTGRGKDQLSRDQHKRLRQIGSYYADDETVHRFTYAPE